MGSLRSYNRGYMCDEQNKNVWLVKWCVFYSTNDYLNITSMSDNASSYINGVLVMYIVTRIVLPSKHGVRCWLLESNLLKACFAAYAQPLCGFTPLRTRTAQHVIVLVFRPFSVVVPGAHFAWCRRKLLHARPLKTLHQAEATLVDLSSIYIHLGYVGVDVRQVGGLHLREKSQEEHLGARRTMEQECR